MQQMTEQQQILEYIESLPGDLVKAIVREWMQQPDATLSHFKQLAETAHRTRDIDTTVGFPNLTEDEILEECETRLKQQIHRGIPHEQVAEWLRSLSTDHPLPCPKSVG
ncbi:hypothetical protein [Leptolyngbya sp. NIES-2104]|uniref:hypothetical protein n=1 Tax=Leptolyngbya sp. NIES-2104 TaxID=1552121 RepID=UPI00073E6164|nr:hypothetical protein [Leptolyngbya sp. NIES-2104]